LDIRGNRAEGETSRDTKKSIDAFRDFENWSEVDELNCCVEQMVEASWGSFD
jgi:hypothetical protein